MSATIYEDTIKYGAFLLNTAYAAQDILIGGSATMTA